MLLENAKIQLKDIGNSLSRTSFYAWDEPMNLVATHLGGLDNSNRAIVLLYSDEINTASAALDDIEKRDDAFEREISGDLPPAAKVAIAGGSGMALLGIGALAYMMLRKK
jgi:hypothetical protein